MDLAQLGMAVDTRDVRSADDDLGRFTKSADKAAKSADYFQDATGRWRDKSGKFVTATDRARLGLDNFEKSSGKVTSSVRSMAVQMASVVGVVASINQAFGAAEQYTTMTNSLRGMGLSATEAAMVAQIAERTRAPLDTTASLYRRISVAAGELGASQQEVLRFTENIGLALAASGSGANEASGALLQLSQAMSSGIVRAEEFNSILENAYPVAQAAARGIDEAGGSVGRLRAMVVEGKVSSDAFFDAIISQTAVLQAAFASTVPTIDQAVGGSAAVAGAILALGNAAYSASALITENIGTVVAVMERVAAYTATAAAIFGGAYVVSLVAAKVETITFSGALGVARKALISLGFGELIVGAGELALWFGKLVNATGGWGSALSALGDLAEGIWEGITTSSAAIGPALNSVWETVKQGFYNMLSAVQSGWAKFLFGLAGRLPNIPFFDDWGDKITSAANEANSAVVGYAAQADGAAQASARLNKEAESFVSSGWAKASEAALTLRMLMDTTGDEIDGVTESTNAYNEALENSAGAAGSARRAASSAANSVNKLADEIERLEDAADPTRKFRREMEKLDKLLDHGLSDGAYAHAVRELNTELVESTPIVSDLNAAFGSMVDYMFDGFKDGMRGIWNIFTDTLKNMAAAALKHRITIGVGAAVSGVGGAAAAGQGGGILSGAGMLNGIWGTASAPGLFGGAGLLGMGGDSGLLGLGAGSGLAGTLGGGVFGAAASVALPVIGIGLALGALFKKTEVLVAEGVRARIDGAVLELDSYTKSKTDNGFGLSSSFKRDFDRLDDAVQVTVGAQLDATLQSLGAFGLNTDLTGFSFSKRAEIKSGESFEGESEEVIREALNAAIGFLTGGALEVFRVTGEDLTDTLTRLLTYLTILILSLTGCATSQTEGRAAAILDAAEPHARQHAGNLADGDVNASRTTGARLLAVLGQWYLGS